MKLRVIPIVLSAFLILGLASCGENGGPANDPSVAAGVMGSTTAMCMTPAGGGTGVAVAMGTSGDFTGSRFAAEIAGLNADDYVFANVTFTNYSANYNGKTYTLNGTLSIASTYDLSVTQPSPGITRSALTSTTYCLASGVTLVGDDYNGSFEMDCRQILEMVITQSGGTPSTSVNLTTTGLVAGQTYSNALIAATY